MEEGNANIAKMLDSLLTKLDEQTALRDKQLEAQLSFNNQIAQELRGLARQLDLTQADVDATRKTVDCSASHAGSVTTLVPPPPPPPPPPPSPRHQPHHAEPHRPASAHARLGDNRPPLIPVPPLGAPMAGVTAPPPSPNYTENSYHKPPKHDFPRFDGSAPYL